jgi:predicted XRE-type DNA-binding protein
MYEKKNNTTGRNNYYLTIEQKQEIKDYVIAHPELSQEKIAAHFGVSRTIISNTHRTPSKDELYEIKIAQLVAENTILQGKIAALKKQIKNK